MNIRDAIDKATKLPVTNENPSFVLLTKPDQSTIDHKMNRRKVRPPRNIKLVEHDPEPDPDWDTNCTLDENEILSSIKAVNGGISYSNKAYEDHWKSRQLQQQQVAKTSDCDAMPSTSKSSCSSSSVTEMSDIENTKSGEPEETKEISQDTDPVHEVLKKCYLSKNAAISGLLNSNQIKLEDLKIPKKTNSKSEKSQNKPDTDTRNIALGDCLVPHPDEPDIFIHPLQMKKTFEKTEDGAADLMVEHVGVKKTITPRQYYINETDKMSFEFVKKNPKDK